MLWVTGGWGIVISKTESFFENFWLKSGTIIGNAPLMTKFKTWKKFMFCSFIKN
jgi:hypothetical protein